MQKVVTDQYNSSVETKHFDLDTHSIVSTKIIENQRYSHFLLLHYMCLNTLKMVLTHLFYC